MKRSVKWHAPNATVDWQEILAYTMALDALHGSTTWLDLHSGGTRHATNWRVTVVSVFPVVSGKTQGTKLATSTHWPNTDNVNMAEAIYNLLLRHDYRISEELYIQTELPTAER